MPATVFPWAQMIQLFACLLNVLGCSEDSFGCQDVTELTTGSFTQVFLTNVSTYRVWYKIYIGTYVHGSGSENVKKVHSIFLLYTYFVSNNNKDCHKEAPKVSAFKKDWLLSKPKVWSCS